MKKLKIAWITGDYFIDVDFLLVPYMKEHYKNELEIHWIVIKSHNSNVSSTNSKQSKLCVKCTLYIDTRLFGKHAVRRNRPQYVYDEIVKASVS